MLKVKIALVTGEDVAKNPIQDRLIALTRKLLPHGAGVVPRIKNGRNGYSLDPEGFAKVLVANEKNLTPAVRDVIEKAGFYIVDE